LTRAKIVRSPTVEVRAVCDCPDVDTEAVRLYAGNVMAATGNDKFELSVLLADDAYVRQLNRRYRGVDRTTNVMAFPQQDDSQTLPVPTAPLGDVVISVEKAARDSARAGNTLLDELKKLVVHGILHLSGHDHRTGPQARKMRQLEEAIIERTAKV
jgi:probable rRNA maturation factor